MGGGGQQSPSGLRSSEGGLPSRNKAPPSCISSEGGVVVAKKRDAGVVGVKRRWWRPKKVCNEDVFLIALPAMYLQFNVNKVNTRKDERILYAHTSCRHVDHQGWWSLVVDMSLLVVDGHSLICQLVT